MTGDHYAAALLACTPKNAEVVIARGDPDRRATFFDALDGEARDTIMATILLFGINRSTPE
jgi:hypothetical protein